MRIGILGGTFNPIHNGHISLAQQAKQRLRLDKVIFVPANVPPHKSKTGILPAWQRYKMAAMAIEREPCFDVSDYEIKKGGTSYSVRTLGAFRKRFGQDAKLYFLAGSDSLPHLKTWKRLDKIIKLAEFVVASRRGYKFKKMPGIKVISVATPDVSSTTIRRMLKRGLSVKRFLPNSVYNYIKSRRLYR